ncbi:MAG TPA: Hsp20/alpha crystallin family protein [bacterium]|nr:Hsp20/alpha crystallin family protein [bacterium]
MDKMVRWNPFRELVDVRDDFDRIVDRIFKPEVDFWEGHTKAPLVDIYEENDSVIVKAEIPGMKKEEIEVSITDDAITLSGKKKDVKEVKKENIYRKEIREGAFLRTLPLPCAIDRDNIKASYKEGVLEINLPKAAEEKKKELKVNIQ